MGSKKVVVRPQTSGELGRGIATATTDALAGVRGLDDEVQGTQKSLAASRQFDLDVPRGPGQRIQEHLRVDHQAWQSPLAACVSGTGLESGALPTTLRAGAAMETSAQTAAKSGWTQESNHCHWLAAGH